MEEKLFSTKMAKIVLVAAIAAMALTAMTAASASASIVNAKFSTASEFYIKAPTGVTVKKNGGSAKSCTMANIRTASNGGAAEFVGYNGPFQEVNVVCSGSPSLVMRFYGLAKYDTVTGRYWLQVEDGPSTALSSPWGEYWQISSGLDQWNWVNGSGTTQSTITLNEVRVGYTTSTHEYITISGNLTVTTLTGGLITLTH